MGPAVPAAANLLNMADIEDPSADIICKCFQVNEATIRGAIKSGDLTSVESVTRACEAGGGCHSCHILIQLFIDQHQELKKGPAPEPGGRDRKIGFFSRLFGGRSKR